MADIYTKEKRSSIMSKVRGKDTRPELLVRSLLHKMGYRFRLHSDDLPGRPDVCLPKYKTVIFVHGCYWHRHADCKKGRSFPASNREFWEQKFHGTIERDKNVEKELESLGWNVVVIWQCETQDIETLKIKLIRSLACRNLD